MLHRLMANPYLWLLWLRVGERWSAHVCDEAGGFVSLVVDGHCFIKIPSAVLRVFTVSRDGIGEGDWYLQRVEPEISPEVTHDEVPLTYVEPEK